MRVLFINATKKVEETPLSLSSGQSGDSVVIIVVNGTVYTGQTKAEAWTKAREDQTERNKR